MAKSVIILTTVSNFKFYVSNIQGRPMLRQKLKEAVVFDTEHGAKEMLELSNKVREMILNCDLELKDVYCCGLKGITIEKLADQI